MKQFTSQKHIVTIISIMVVIVAVVWIVVAHSSAKMTYDGPRAMLTTPSRNASFQIDNTVLNIPPKIPPNTQVNIHLSAFTLTAAKGSITYSHSYSPVQFMVAKSGDKWIVVTHNTGKTLLLPNITTAKKYNLPTGWYTNN